MMRNKAMVWLLIVCMAFPGTLFAADDAELPLRVTISDFESDGQWNGKADIRDEQSWEGSYAHKWTNMDAKGTGNYPGADKIFQSLWLPVTDWSGYDRLSFKMKVAVPPTLPNQTFAVLALPPAGTAGAYNSPNIAIGSNTEWQQITLDLSKFSKSGSPPGWDQIGIVRFHPNRVGNAEAQIDPNMVIYIDDLVLGRAPASIAASSSELTLASGASEPLAITATMPDATTPDVTEHTMYASSDKSVASVDKLGNVTAIAEGTATITADYLGVTTIVHVTVGDAAPDYSLTIDNFEHTGTWGNVVITPDQAYEGTRSGKWENMPQKTAISATNIPHDWSPYSSLEFWVYSEKATNQGITIILDSNNESTSQNDYYSSGFTVNWEGYWNKISIPLVSFSPSYSPVGMDKIASIKLHSSWTGAPINGETVIYLDDMKLVKEVIATNPVEAAVKEAVEGGSAVYRLQVTNQADIEGSFDIVLDESRLGEMTASVDKTQTALLQPGETDTIEVTVGTPDESAGLSGELTVSFVSTANASMSKSVVLETVSAASIDTEVEHPRVAMNAEDVAGAKRKAGEAAWAAAARDDITARADVWLTRDITAPMLPAGHVSFFVCPNNNDVSLTYDADSADSFYCSDDGQYYSGTSVSAGWRYLRYRELAEAAQLLGQAYVLSDNESYAERARDIMVQLADWHANFPVQSKGGTLTWTTLDQSVLLTYLAQAYDLIYTSDSLSDNDKFNIERNFLKSAAEIVKETTVDGGLSNFHAWHNAAFVAVGAAIDDPDLIEYGIKGPYGFEFQMEKSVWEDGFWYEGSPAYHAYALQAYAILVEAAYHNGYDLYNNGKYKSMVDVLLDVAYPNLQIPTVNDGGSYGYTWLADSPSLELEVPYARIGDPKYAWLLNEKYGTHAMPRKGVYALFHGVAEIPEVQYKPGSINFGGVGDERTGIGLGILRSGSGAQMSSVLMDYGPFGGSHGHHDKLHIDLFGQGIPLAPDLGTPSYSSQYYRDYYKTTVSHNTVVLNESIQKRRAGANDNDTLRPEVAGKMSLFSATFPELQMMEASSDPTDENGVWGGAYESTSYKRAIAQTPEYSIDLFHVGSTVPGDTESRTYDYVMHGLGTFDSSLAMSPRAAWSSAVIGYKFLQNPVSAEVTGDGVWDASWSQGDVNMKLTMLDNGDSEVIRADGPGTQTTVLQPVLLVRKTGSPSAEYTAILESYTGESGHVASAQRVDDNRIHVALASGEQDYFYYNHAASGNAELAYSYIRSSEEIEPVFPSAEVDDETLRIEFPLPDKPDKLATSVHIFRAAGVTAVELNGAPAAYERSGDYIIVKAAAKDSDPDPDPDPGPGPGSDVDIPHVPKPEETIVGSEAGVTLLEQALQVSKETTANGGSRVKAVVKADSLAAALDRLRDRNEGERIIAIQLDQNADEVSLEFPASVVGETSADAVLSVSTGKLAYELPLKAIDLAAILEQLQSKSEDIRIVITMGSVSGELGEKLKAKAEGGTFDLVGDAYEFAVHAFTESGDSLEINDYDGVYAARTIEFDEIGLADTTGLTAVYYDAATDEFYFVPAIFELEDGVLKAVMKRSGNSVYAVIHNARTFGDMTGHWAQEETELLASKLVISGVSPDRFAPDREITRAEFTALLVRALGIRPASANAAFNDVDAGDWYAGVIGAAVQAGLVQGFADGTFRPDERITRGQMAVMLASAMKYTGAEERLAASHEDILAAFADGSEIAEWAARSVAQAVQADIMRGKPGGVFDAGSHATRAQAAVVLHGMLQHLRFMN